MKRRMLVLILVSLGLLCSCASSAALKNMCLVQEVALKRYVAEANPKLPENWQEVGNKLIRNQGTINKLVGAAR